MKRFLFLGLLLFAFFNGNTQNFAIGIPDSVENVAFPGSTGAYGISNPLNHNGTSFTNPPISGNCILNCKSDYLYFHDFDFNIPLGATILGIEMIHTRGGCNSGSFVIDTLHLAYNGAPIGNAKRDSASQTNTDTLGSSADQWGAFLSTAMVNDPSFGVMLNSTGTGICTFGQFDVRLIVYYCEWGVPVQGIPDSVVNVAFSGSTGAYSVTNPLNHNGTQFTNPPVSVNCILNCKSDWLYFHDFGFNVASGQLINGIEVIHSRGGCNSGSFVIDTLAIAYGGAPIGTVKRDSASTLTTDTLGYQNDDWGNMGIITGAMASDPSFGVMIRSTGTGICTFGHFDVRINLYYCGESQVNVDQAQAITEVTFYPNPATDRIHWTHPETVSRVVCLNALGQTVDAPQMGDALDVSQLPNGIYFMRVTRVDGALKTKRVMVQH